MSEDVWAVVKEHDEYGRLEGLFPLKDLQLEIEKLTANPRTLSVEAFKPRLLNVLKGYSHGMTQILPNPCFRARKWDHMALPTSVKDLWYPPPDRVLKLGRMNRPGQSMFYGADGAGPAIFETSQSVGRKVALLECGIAGDHWPLVAEVGVSEFRRDTALGREFLQHNTNVKMDRERSLRQSIVREFLRNQLSRIVLPDAEDDYKLGVAISETLFEYRGLGGIAYPSVAAGHEGINIALRPEVADRCLVPRAVKIVEIVDYAARGEVHGRVVAQSERINDDKTILWNPEGLR